MYKNDTYIKKERKRERDSQDLVYLYESQQTQQLSTSCYATKQYVRERNILQ